MIRIMVGFNFVTSFGGILPVPIIRTLVISSYFNEIIEESEEIIEF